MEIDDLKPYSVVCRGCLAESGDMKNMYEWGLSEDFHVFADIVLQRSNNLSELLCASCEQQLLGCRDFRKQCQQAQEIMSQRMEEIKKKKNTKSLETNITEIKIDHQLTEKDLTINITTGDLESKIYLPCPYYCGSKFIKKKDLLKHFSKIHGVDNIAVLLNYCCPHEKCNNKSFSERKFLNQHLNKVHKERTFNCQKCNNLFTTETEIKRHILTCDFMFICGVCNIQYKTNERLLVHLLRKHPDLHKEYKQRKKKLLTVVEDLPKKQKVEEIWDSPKRTSATQTLDNIKNDVALPSWQTDRNFSTIETQTVCDDIMSLKSQNSEEDSIFYSETVSLSDIQTQTFPIEFGLSKTESETQTKHDLSIKETQTCVCHYDSPRTSFKLFDSVNNSPNNLASCETQTYDKVSLKSDVLLSFNSAETQTCFDNDL